MRRIKEGILIIIALLLLAIILKPLILKNASSFNKRVVSEQKAQEIMSVRTIDPSVMTDIYFDVQKLTVDADTMTIYYSLSKGGKNAYNPSVIIGSSDNPRSIVFVNDRITPEVIRSNTSIKTIIYDENSYCTFDLVCTTLPIMTIESQVEISDLDSRVNMTLLDENLSSGGFTSSEGLMRIRGGTSKSHPKNSYKLSLMDGTKSKKMSLLGMRSDDDWILYSCYGDPERVRNVFSQRLWYESCRLDNHYKIDTGVKYRYIELFINNKYMGLYALGYKQDEKTLGINDFAEDEGLYKKIDFEISGFEPEKSEYSIYSIYDYYSSIEENADDDQYLESIVDIDNALDFNLFITLTQGADNIYKNYLVLLKNFSGEKKAIYIPWDLDLTWGDTWNEGELNNIGLYDYSPEDNIMFYDSCITQLLLNGNDEFYQTVHDKYTENRRRAWSEDSVDELLDELETEVFDSGAYLRDYERWPDSGNIEGVNSLDQFREYVHQRLLNMDQFIDDLVSVHSDESLRKAFLADAFGEILDEYGAHDDYRFRIDGYTLSDLESWLKYMDNVKGNIILQINDTSILGDDRDISLTEFDIDCGSFLSVQEATYECEELVFVLNCRDRRGTLIENPYVSGTMVSTDYGDYAFFEADGYYGIYMNGNDCQTGNISELRQNGIVISLWDYDWQEQGCRFTN